jgi:hypothetical protein
LGGGRLQRGQAGHALHPGGEPCAALGQINGPSLARHVERHGEDQMSHAQRLLQQRIGRASLEDIGHAMAARDLVSEHGGGTLARMPGHLAHPDRDTVAQAARRGIEPTVSPVGFTTWMMEARPAVEAVEVGTDELTVLHANPGIVHEIRDAPRRIDLIVGLPTVRVFASMISVRSVSPFSTTRMRANRA